MAEERAANAHGTEHRWRGRRVQAWLVRALTFVLPLGASMGAGAILSRLLPSPTGIAQLLSWWAMMLTSVTLTMLATDRLTRRLLPLAALLKLSLIFPDQAPSRFRVAVRAGGTRKLEQRLEDVKTKGLEHTPAEAASTVLELASLLNVHDRKTRGHSERVRVFSDLLADELKLSKPDRDRLHWAALLHDVGKLVVPHEILNKPGAPTEEEWAILRSHPLEGERFVEPLADWLGEWSKAIGQHHEKYDGTGYPRGLAGHDISMAARIVAVADSYEVMTAARAYKRPMPAAEARRELARCAGTQFDPMIVRAFLNISLGKVRLAMGPLSWLTQLPFAQFLPQVGTAASTAASTAVATASTAAAMVLGGVAAPEYTPSATAAAAPELAGGGTPPPREPAPLPFDPDDIEPPADPAAPKPPTTPPDVNDDRVTIDEDVPVGISVMANDVAGSHPLAPSSLSWRREAATGTVHHDGRGVLTFVPAPNMYGTTAFRYSLCDTEGVCDDGAVTLHILPVNDDPVARSDSAEATDTDPVTIAVLANDSDVDGDYLTVTAAAAHTGHVSVNGDGSLTYVARKSWSGTDTLTYEVVDGHGGRAVGLVTVLVDGENEDPEAHDDAAKTDEDVAVTIPVLANDRDPDDDPLHVAEVGRAGHGTVVPAGGGVAYTPRKNWHGTDSFTYTVSDGKGGSASARVTVTVASVNDKPVAAADGAKAEEDGSVTIDVLANDTDPDVEHDDDKLRVEDAGDGGFGTVTVDASGAIVYTPKPNAYGVDTFTYTVADLAGATATATVTVKVEPVADEPIAVNVTVTGQIDEPLIPITMSASDPNDENRPDYPTGPSIVGYEILSTPAAGTLYYDNDPGAADAYLPAVAGVRTNNPVLRFTPPPGQTGAFAFTYRAIDAGHPTSTWTAPATGTITISESALLLSYRADGSVSTPLRGEHVHGLAYIFLQDHPSLAGAQFWLDNPAMAGPPHSTDGSTRFDFNNGAAWDTAGIAPGTHTITALVTRGDASTFVISSTFTVGPNAAPTAVDDDVQLNEDGVFDVAVLANDSDANGDTLAVIGVTAPTNGTATIKADGTIRYRPAADWFGTDSFTYQLDDGHGATSTATVRVTVLPVPDAPVARSDVDNTNLLGAASIDVLANDTDADGDLDPTSVTIILPPLNGTATVQPDNTVLYQADLLFEGVDTFRYRVCDSGGRCSTAIVRVGVNNDAPTAVDDTVTTAEDTPVTVDVVANDTDPDPADTPLIAWVATPTNGTVVVSADRKSITYTPDPQWNGTEVITYATSDGILSDTGTLTVTVTPANDPPVAVDDTAVTTVDNSVLIDVVANDTDVDLQPLTVTAVGTPASGTAVIEGNAIRFTPAPGVYGVETFDYTVGDGSGLFDTAQVTVTINALPVAGADAAAVNEDGGEISIDVLDNDSDPEGATLTITGVGGALKGVASIAPEGDHIHYTPNPDAFGTDSFTYQLSDGISTVSGMITVTINPIADNPIAVDDDVLIAKDTTVEVDVVANDTDADGDLAPGSVVVTGGPSHGMTSVDPVTGAITYTPVAGWAGIDTFTYEVCDGLGACAQAQVRVTVSTPPTAVDDTGATTTGNTVQLMVLANDVPGDAAITGITIITPPANGTAQVVAGGTRIAYNPTSGFTGTDTITYQVVDANGLTSTATVTITVTP